MSPDYVIGFTGTQSLSSFHQYTINPVLDSLAILDPNIKILIVTGACYGVDSYVARRLFRVRPDWAHLVLYPDDPRTKDKVDWSLKNYMVRDNVEHRTLPEGTSNKVRNQMIVDLSNRLIGFPLHEETSQPRSGTWQTIRMARKAGIKLSVEVLEPGQDGLSAKEFIKKREMARKAG